METTLLDALEGVDGSHIENHEDQAAAIALLDEEQVENRNRISALESDKAGKDAVADVASDVSELREDYAELLTAFEAVRMGRKWWGVGRACSRGVRETCLGGGRGHHVRDSCFVICIAFIFLTPLPHPPSPPRLPTLHAFSSRLR